MANVSDHSAAFENVAKVLSTMKSADKKRNLLDHVQSVFQELILHYPKGSLDKFEEVSYLLKHSDNKKLQEFLKVEDNRNYQPLSNTSKDFINKASAQFSKPPVEGDEDVGEEAAAEVGFVQDLMADSRIFQWAGIGFGEQETYRLQKSLKKLAETSGSVSLRFYGKIWGTKQDYYIVEASGDANAGGEEEGEGQEEEEGEGPTADSEPRGSGVNKLSYYVAHDSMSKWTRLPDLSPNDIKASRQIKVVFTGDLNRPIYTNPFFFGQEKHYLRAQIARIMHSTTLYPKTLWMEDAENPREVVAQEPAEGDEEVEQPTTMSMTDPKMWVHANPNILLNCLTEHKDAEAPADNEEEFDQEKANEALQLTDPYEKRLKSISLDGKVKISEKVQQAAWVVRLMGDGAEYALEKQPAPAGEGEKPKKLQTQTFGVVMVRSLLWPGAVSFYSNGRIVQIYLGNGHKFEQVAPCYFPVHPPEIMDDVSESDYKNEPEPTPLEEPPAEVENAEGSGQEEANSDEE